ncbi:MULTISPECIES: hypothetical protein [unclassified Burkholderia]|uniref:hypothetical protein n=1 Tax=unclassified Burkholderia TaxID=2613784 RepID=UPI0015C604A4|nr:MULTISPECIES: hypothetical protein [unclassified Burkholderia]
MEITELGRDERAVVAERKRGGNKSVGHAKQKTWQPSLARDCAGPSDRSLEKANGAAHGRTALRILSGWRWSKNGQSVIHSAKYR